MQKVTYNGVTFLATKNQADALAVLTDTRAGGIATVKAYVSTSGRIKPETADIQFLSRFSYSRLLNRKIAALQALTVEQVKENAKEKKLIDLNQEAFEQAFNNRRQYLVESAQKTLDGVRDDAHRQAHDRCYTRVSDGVRVHFKTVMVDKVKEPVTVDGIPVAESILVDILEINRKIIEAGEYKPVNSGVPVLMENVMMGLLPKSVKFKAISLKPDNFDSLHIDGAQMLPDEFKGIFD